MLPGPSRVPAPTDLMLSWRGKTEKAENKWARQFPKVMSSWETMKWIR